MKTLRILFLLASIVIGLGIVQVAAAQDGDGGTDQPPLREVTDDEVNQIASQLFCPVCENIPLDVCPTQACADWRAEIRTMLEQGRSEQEIKDYFVERYGQRVLATPQKQGFNLLVWIIPPLALLLGAGAAILALRRLAPSARAAGGASKPVLRYDDLDAEYVARLESDLKEMG